MIQVSISKRLAALHSLRTLRAHLELPKLPIAAQSPPGEAAPMSRRRAVFARHYPKIERLCETAATLGRALPQSGLALWLLQRMDFDARWMLFRPVIKEDVDDCPQAELDPAGGAVSVVVPLSLIRPLTYFLGNSITVLRVGSHYRSYPNDHH